MENQNNIKKISHLINQNDILNEMNLNLKAEIMMKEQETKKIESEIVKLEKSIKELEIDISILNSDTKIQGEYIKTKKNKN